ncbi:hypothetical protein BJ508DRAFT_362226 [Ascobolus immersus RN42]|uniref:BTB domain-containing protein n=1 Tax=Ascobolus immersus RN42 TaxID=1160509 RepID=A0A3N4I4K1_ASCIM|nr:hypothetical protein BJ508DRAFT_362226 [Ascobolus immersus RN42]
MSNNKFEEHFTSAQIEVRVGRGENQKSFKAHESALTESSEYFKTTLSFPNGIEKETRVIKLEEDVDEPEIFGFFLQNCYTGTVQMGLTLEKGQLTKFAKLYALGDRLISPSTREFAFGVLRDRLQNGQATQPSFFVDDLVDAATIIYRKTPYPTPEEEIAKNKKEAVSEYDDDDGEVTENTGDIESSRRIRALFTRYMVYNIKAVRERRKTVLVDLARENEDFCVDMLSSDDLVSAATTRQEASAASNPLGAYGLGYIKPNSQRRDQVALRSAAQ